MKNKKFIKKRKAKDKEVKKIYRSQQDKIIAGVCGGIGEYFNIDPVWIRLLAILLVLVDLVGIILYVAAWIIIPKNPHQKDKGSTIAEQTVADARKNLKNNKREEKRILLGIILIAIGILMVVQDWPRFVDVERLIEIGIIAAGVYLVLKKN